MRPPPIRSRAALLVTVLTSATLAGCDDSSSPPVLGVSTSARFVDAARLALSDAEAADELPPVTVRMIPVATNRTLPALDAAEELVSEERLVAVVGHATSAGSLAASQIYNERGVVQIAPHSSAEAYSDAGPWSFRLVPPDDQQAAFLMTCVEQTHPGEGARVAAVYVNDSYGRGLLTNLLDRLDAGPHELVLRYPYTEEGGDTDAERLPALTALEDSRPDVLLWLGRGTTLHGWLPELRERLPGLSVIGSDGVAAAPQLTVGDGRWDGVHFVDFIDLGATEALRDFARRYEERFAIPAVGPDALTYDATRLLLDALADGATTPAEVRRFLVELGRERPAWEGITGPVRFDEEGDVDRGYVCRTTRDPR